MRKSDPTPVVALAMLLVAGAVAHGCRAWPEANQDVTELRKINRALHDNTVAKNPTDTAKVESLFQKEDAIFQHLSDLTK